MFVAVWEALSLDILQVPGSVDLILRDRLEILGVIEVAEKARKDFHKKELGISDNLKREVVTIDTMIGDVKRLTDLVPDFGDKADKYRGKRQLAVIGASLTGLAGFLLGNVLGRQTR